MINRLLADRHPWRAEQLELHVASSAQASEMGPKDAELYVCQHSKCVTDLAFLKEQMQDVKFLKVRLHAQSLIAHTRTREHNIFVF